MPLLCVGSTLLIGMSLQEDAVVYAGWQFFLIVRNHNHRLVWSLAESFYYVLGESTVSVVESVKRLVQDKELRVFDEGTCQKHQSLFATGEFEETSVFQSFQSEYFHPEFTFI